MTIPGYSKVYQIDKREAKELFPGEVVVEEKVDGSQISFGKIDGKLIIRSKGDILDQNDPPKMFNVAVTNIKSLELPEGFIFRAEYLKKPKHNILKYDRVPKLNVVVFDTYKVTGDILEQTGILYRNELANMVGLECVPVFYEGKINHANQLDKYLDNESFLGGPKVEGLVVKRHPYWKCELLGQKPLSAKILSERFKEVRDNQENKKNRVKKDIVTIIAEDLTTDARFAKATQRLRERGDLIGTMEDIRNLVIEVGKDVKSEETEFIKDKLFKWAWPLINKDIIKELPAWYSKELQGDSDNA